MFHCVHVCLLFVHYFISVFIDNNSYSNINNINSKIIKGIITVIIIIIIII